MMPSSACPVRSTWQPSQCCTTRCRRHWHIIPAGCLIVDLDGVTVLDDSGLGVLLGAAGSARQGGADLVVVCNNNRLRERFDVTGFSRAVEVRERLKGDRS